MCVWGVMGYAEITAGRQAFTACVTAIEPSMTLVVLTGEFSIDEGEVFGESFAGGFLIIYPSSATIWIASAGHS